MVKTLIKLVFSSLIIFYLFSQAPLNQVLQALRKVRLDFILAAGILYLMAQVLSAYKWNLIARPLGFKKKFINIVAYYFIGMFFNLFMLGSIGGDVVRAYYLGGKTKRIIPAGYSIFIERYTGGLALITILSIAILIPFKDSTIPSFASWSIIGGTVIVWLVTIFMPKILSFFPLIKKWGEKIHLQKMKVYWDEPQMIKGPILISFLFQTLFILIIILVGWGFGIKVPLYYFFIFVPLGDLLSILPITLNGIGVREGCYVFFLHLGGVNTSTALAFSLLCLVVVWGVSLLGGIVYLFGNFDGKVISSASVRSLKEMEVETSLN
jgi:hypothetical protein